MSPLKYTEKTRQMTGWGFQLICFLASCCILVALFYPRFKHFKAYDSRPVFFRWPQEADQLPRAIKTGLHIRNFTEFNTTRSEFVLHGLLWFEGEAESVRNAALTKFTVLNGEFLAISEPHVIAQGEKLLVYFDIRLRFKPSLDHSSFPIDDHRIIFGLTNYDLASDTIFAPSGQNITFSGDFYVPGWLVVDRKIETGHTTVALVPNDPAYSLQHPRIMFSMDCKRIDPCEIITMLLSLMLILLIVVCTLSSTEYSLHIVSGGIVALISYRFIVEAMSPPHVHYFMIADYLFLAALLAIIIGLFAAIMMRQKKLSAEFQYASVILTYGVFLVGCIVAVIVG